MNDGKRQMMHGSARLEHPVKGLVLERGRGEQVFIGDDIVVSVVGVIDGKVKMHFQAPKSTVISRGEFGMESHRHKQRERAEGL